MTEKLIIKHFAGIKDLEIEVRKINILIGPQASGKSVCAKLLFYFKNFVWTILLAVENDQTKRDIDSSYSKTFEEYFPPDSWGNQDFLIRYEISGEFIEINRKQNARRKISLSYSDFFRLEYMKLRTWLKKAKEKDSNENLDTDDSFVQSFVVRALAKSYLSTLIENSIGEEAAFTQLFIPAGRSFFANLQTSIFTFLTSNNALDPFLKLFGSTYENLKPIRFRAVDKLRLRTKDDLRDEINKLVEDALCGRHIRNKGKDFLETTDGRRVSISSASSGQQETLPLTVILASLPELTASGSGQTVYIEEPEAHLFPSAQRSVIELIATVFNYREDKLQFFITTHSPYVLTVFNNLLQAGLLYGEGRQDLLSYLEEVVPRYKALYSPDVSAYALKDGKCSSIICPEMGLIDATVIDSVSDDLAIEFDKLLNLV